MNNEIAKSIKEYYEINEKIKELEKRKSELKEVLYSVLDSENKNELEASDILFYRDNRPRISWDELILKSILSPKGLWESVLGVDNKKVRNLIVNRIISEKELEKAKIAEDTWYTYAKRIPKEQNVSRSSSIIPPSKEIMGIKRLVITDVSRMKEGRVCIFGIDKEKRHIRPEIPYQSWHERDLFDETGKQIIKPFAELEFDFIRQNPKPPHTEDFEINASHKPKLVRNLLESESKRFLDEILDESVKTIFGAVIQDNKYLNPGEGKRSLGTVKVKECFNLKYFMKEPGKHSYRLEFSDMSGSIYDLKITDYSFTKYYMDLIIRKQISAESVCEILKRKFNQVEIFLRVGLARPFEKMYNRCYLQISGIHTFPDYRE